MHRIALHRAPAGDRGGRRPPGHRRSSPLTGRRHVAGRRARRRADVGIVCTTAPDAPTFDMTTDADYISLPDGNTVYMYGYKLVGTPFQHPEPGAVREPGRRRSRSR